MSVAVVLLPSWVVTPVPSSWVSVKGALVPDLVHPSSIQKKNTIPLTDAQDRGCTYVQCAEDRGFKAPNDLLVPSMRSKEKRTTSALGFSPFSKLKQFSVVRQKDSTMEPLFAMPG